MNRKGSKAGMALEILFVVFGKYLVVMIGSG
jgi:hypothetical protein